MRPSILTSSSNHQEFLKRTCRNETFCFIFYGGLDYTQIGKSKTSFVLGSIYSTVSRRVYITKSKISNHNVIRQKYEHLKSLIKL
jgi:hypothetical protein